MSSFDSEQASPVIDVPVTAPPAMTPTSIEDFQNYLSYRTPPALVIGGCIGSSVGFYSGDAMALYGYSYAAGLGIVTTSFYSGVYGMKYLRQKDDNYNYAVSGCFNGAILGTASGGPKRGLIGSAVGIVGGIAMKYIGQWFYNTSRASWINYRRITIEESRPRILEARIKMKKPKEGEFYSEREVITLRTDQWPTWQMATKSPVTDHYRIKDSNVVIPPEVPETTN